MLERLRVLAGDIVGYIGLMYSDGVTYNPTEESSRKFQEDVAKFRMGCHERRERLYSKR